MVNLPKEFLENNELQNITENLLSGDEVKTYICKNYLGKDQIPSDEDNILDFVERMADLSVAFSVLSGRSSYPADPGMLQRVTNTIRSFYKIEFKLLCNYCETPHYQDEITAPER